MTVVHSNPMTKTTYSFNLSIGVMFQYSIQEK